MRDSTVFRISEVEWTAGRNQAHLLLKYIGYHMVIAAVLRSVEILVTRHEQTQLQCYSYTEATVLEIEKKSGKMKMG